MTTAEEKAIKQAEHKQRVKDLKLQKFLDESWEIFFYVINDDNLLLEMNIRLQQYKQQFPAFGIPYIIWQTLQDFNKHYVILQKKQLDYNQPLAMRKDQTIISINFDKLMFR